MKFLLGSTTPQIVNPRSLNRLLSLLKMNGNLRKVSIWFSSLIFCALTRKASLDFLPAIIIGAADSNDPTFSLSVSHYHEPGRKKILQHVYSTSPPSHS
jgi:hypothetical protein